MTDWIISDTQDTKKGGGVLMFPTAQKRKTDFLEKLRLQHV